MAAVVSMAACSHAWQETGGDRIGDRDDGHHDGLGVLARFRAELYSCLTSRGDELFELADAVLAPTGR